MTIQYTLNRMRHFTRDVNGWRRIGSAEQVSSSFADEPLRLGSWLSNKIPEFDPYGRMDTQTDGWTLDSCINRLS